MQNKAGAHVWGFFSGIPAHADDPVALHCRNDLDCGKSGNLSWMSLTIHIGN